MGGKSTNPNRLKYKVYRVVNVRTGKVSRLAGVGIEFPHEVLPAMRDRYAIAGWFRLNSSIANNIDPPR